MEEGEGLVSTCFCGRVDVGCGVREREATIPLGFGTSMWEKRGRVPEMGPGVGSVL